jgi:L-galactose dehydrogenase
MHWHLVPHPTLSLSQLFRETLPALGRLRDQGLVKALGVTGYPLDIYPYVLDK